MFSAGSTGFFSGFYRVRSIFYRVLFHLLPGPLQVPLGSLWVLLGSLEGVQGLVGFPQVLLGPLQVLTLFSAGSPVSAGFPNKVAAPLVVALCPRLNG